VKQLTGIRLVGVSFSVASGKGVVEYLENYQQLIEMIERGEVSEIAIAHKDQLVRFGFESFKQFCTDHGCQITI